MGFYCNVVPSWPSMPSMHRSAGLMFVSVVLASGHVACGADPAPERPVHVPSAPPSVQAVASASPSAPPPQAEPPHAEPPPFQQPSTCSVDGYCWESPIPGATGFRGVFSAGENEVYVGAGARILHFSGTSWRYERLPVAGEVTCFGGSGPYDVVAAGGGFVARRTEGVWRAISGTGEVFVQAVWSGGSNEVFAAGDNGVILRYDGETWQSEVTGTKANITALWGTASSGLYAVGNDANGGVALRRDAAGWSPLPRVGQALIGIWGKGPDGVDGVWAAGTDDAERLAVWRLAGSTWKAEGLRVEGQARALSGVAGAPVLLGLRYLDPDRLELGPTSVFTARLDARRWVKSEVLVTSPLLTGASWSLHGDARGGLFVAGGWGVVGSIEAAGFRGLSGNASLGKKLTGVWGTSPSDVVAVGAEGALLHYDG